MTRPMTPMEAAVGRRLPPAPKHIDTVMARWAPLSDETSQHERARLAPPEEWLRPAFRKAVKNGWIRRTNMSLSFHGSRPEPYFVLTPSGKIEATAAALRVKAAEEKRREWAKDSQQTINEGRFPAR